MRRPINQTYFYILDRIGDVEALSIKKRFCLAFLRWGTKMQKADMVEFVELAMEWRRQERNYGKHRTILERRARRLYPQIAKLKRKLKAQKGAGKAGRRTVAEGTGVHSPEQKAKRLEANREMVKKRVASGIRPAHWWIVYPPDNAPPIKVYNLKSFSREHGLNPNAMGETATRRREHIKGWRAEKWDPLWDKVLNDYLPEPEETWEKGAPPEGEEFPLRLDL